MLVRWILTAPGCGGRAGDLTIITYGGCLYKALEAAETLEQEALPPR